MICICPPDCTDCSDNGPGVLTPQSCTVAETLNGEYGLTPKHYSYRGEGGRAADDVIDCDLSTSALLEIRTADASRSSFPWGKRCIPSIPDMNTITENFSGRLKNEMFHGSEKHMIASPLISR